jgi:thymidylate synthase (FAD)
MKISTGPKVYVVGHSEIDPHGFYEFCESHSVLDEMFNRMVDDDTSCDSFPEIAGRLCYMSFSKPRPGGNAAYLEHIKESGHGSICEHSTFNLIITGVSRSFTHELVRHRVGFSYSQLSQRFVDESDCEFVCPPIIAEDPELADIWGVVVHYNQEAYRLLAEKLGEKLKGIDDKTLRRKRAREAARSVLPNATETKIFVTGNARSLRHFIEIRSDVAADREIRDVAIKVLEAVKPLAPNLFGDYEIVETPDGGRSAVTKYRKV